MNALLSGEVREQTYGAAAIGRKPDPVEDFLSGDGEMCARIREFDWSETPLGPLDGWPERLGATASMCLKFHLPLGVGGGRDLIFLLNDGCFPFLGLLNPQALG